ncbi:hypothetical protein JCM3766R1_004395, partial [Sporobolomyces carnicolor]
GTISSQKQEMLHAEFGINYNNEPPMFRKGSLIMWETCPSSPSSSEPPPLAQQEEEEERSENSAVQEPPVDAPERRCGVVVGKHMRQRKTPAKPKRRLVVLHEDFINDEWWETGRGKGVLL